jgi:hypothetical protein
MQDGLADSPFALEQLQKKGISQATYRFVNLVFRTVLTTTERD